MGLAIVGNLFANTVDYAGISVDKATVISETTELAVQDGSNYIKITPENLPAIISYMPDTAFGPIPTASIEGADTLVATKQFADCQMQWVWEIKEGTTPQIVNIFARENARIIVTPYLCNVSDTDTTASAWDSFTWYGNTYYQSGDYTQNKIDEKGCPYTHTLHLTILTTTVNYIHETACDSYTLPNGQVITTSGEFLIDTTYNELGKQINILVVTMGETTRETVTLTACNQYESLSGTIYTESGTYVDTVIQYNGCEAIVTLHLTIEDCNQQEGLEDDEITRTPTKIIERGQLYIIRKNEKYTILGTKVQ